MKNILKTLLLVGIFFPIKVEGETFYNDYYLLEKNATEYKEENESLKREEKKLYQNIYYEKGESNYYLLGQNPENYNILNYDNKKMQIFYDNEYSSDCSGPYTSHTVSHNNGVRYIRFNNFIANNTSLKVVKVYSNNEMIFYYVNNINYYFQNILEPQSEFIIDLRDVYLVQNLKIEVYFNAQDLSNINFDFGITDDLINYQNFNNKVLRNKLNEVHTINFINYSLFDDNYFSCSREVYEYYNLKKVNTGVYSEAPLEGYELEYDDFKIVYDYYFRDKIEIKELEEKKQEETIILSVTPTEEIEINYLDLEKDNKKTLKVSTKKNFNFIKKAEIKSFKDNDKVLEDDNISESNEKIIKSLKLNTSNNPIKKPKNQLLYFILIFLPILLLISLIKRKNKNRFCRICLKK